MPLSWNEIRNRAIAFSKEWADEDSEHAEAKSFWDDFFNVFGITRRRVASFEQHVKKIDGKDGFIDLLWKGVLLIEHKSKGKNLERAHKQAMDYFPGLKEAELPQYLIVSDFANFRLYDLEEDTYTEFPLEDFHKNINLFGFIAGYQTHKIEEQNPVNIKAAEKLGKVHDQLKEIGYEGHDLEVYLVRLLFCMFAEDTGIFERQQFQDYIETKTNEDGSDLAYHLDALFHTLNTPEDKRLKNRDEHLTAFPFVNGKLFEERLQLASFDSLMRGALLESCSLDWGQISPAIFGSMFQSIMDKEKRRNLGAHYTSEKNILKVINPLFMDELKNEFKSIRGNKNKLIKFHEKLRSLTFFDPACGCGNFLVIAYRELRLLELEVLRESNKSGQLSMDAHQMVKLDVDQFYGIEIEEFPAQIAQVAMWLMDHQMNLLVSKEFGMYFARIPLKSSANITHSNALRIDWNTVISAKNLNYIMGNPPFVGTHNVDKEQRKDIEEVCGEIKNSGLLDFVCCWYVKAVSLQKLNPDIKCAYVSTNSITQGEQVGVLGSWMFEHGARIFFAHRTFQWSNEARGNAAVHCIIMGFSLQDQKGKVIYDYENIRSEPLAINAKNINQYLADAPNVFLPKRKTPICNVPILLSGNQPVDGGFYSFTPEEKADFLAEEPQAKKYFKRWLGAKEFINGIERWFLLLSSCPPSELKNMPLSKKRVQQVKNFRAGSKRANTKKLADFPTKLGVEVFPKGNYLALPQVSSERREYLPIAFLSNNYICGEKLRVILNCELWHFAILNSAMHMAWMRSVTGRLKSDYQYSAHIVYNNFPWPDSPNKKIKDKIESKAQDVLNARSKFKDATLADLYDPLTMPSELKKAHIALDKAVDEAYGKSGFKTETERVAFLFDLYQKYTNIQEVKPAKVKKERK